MKWAALVLSGVCVVSSSLIARAIEALPTPIPLEVTLRGDGASTTRLAGKLIAADDAGITLRVGQEERSLTWDELVPVSAFGVKFRLIDKAVAGEWLELGRWAWSRGLTTEARSSFANARRLDASLAKEIERIQSEPAGKATAQKPAAPTRDDNAPSGTEAATAAPEVAAPVQPGYVAGQDVIIYTAPTEQEHADSIALTRKRTAEAEAALGVKLVELETAHFLIYTDWDAREHVFLKEQCEGAYRLLARQFNQSPAGNIFVGKLPIYMFAEQKAFQKFAQEFDDFYAPETVLGYFHSSPTEQGHMAMWKPGVGTGIGEGGSKELAMRNWARTLVHEFTHAFIHRYKSNARIPRWLNEGTAEMISELSLPTNNYRRLARQAAVEAVDIMPLFDDRNMPSGEYYPVMMTLAECLQKQDARKFLALFDEIKLGTEPEAALQKVYGIDYVKLVEGWMKYAKSVK